MEKRLLGSAALEGWLPPSEHPHWQLSITLPKHWWLYASLLLLLATVGLAQLIVWRNGSLSHFKIVGQTITKQSANDVQQKLSTRAKQYRLTLVDQDKKSTAYTLDDIGLRFNASKTIDTALKAQKNTPYLQKFAFWRTVKLPISFDEDSVARALFVQDKATRIISTPTNATLQTSSGDAVITAAKDGEGYTFKDATQRISASTSELVPATFWLSKMSVPATVTDSALAPIVDKIHNLARTNITINVDGESFTPSAETITKWIEPITSSAVDAKLEINSGRVQSYFDSILADHIHLPVSQIIMQQPDGTVATLVAGRDGTDVTNESTVVDSIIQHLQSNQSITETLTISHKSYDTVNVNDYDKWILVDLTNKHMYAYEHGQRINDVPVTAGAPATPTVVGQYTIYSKFDSQNMHGRNADGSSYYQPNVRYISYFYKDYAIHGNYWRPLSYFGNINSSHGCVSATNGNAEWFYNWAPIGTPVITHY